MADLILGISSFVAGSVVLIMLLNWHIDSLVPDLKEVMEKKVK